MADIPTPSAPVKVPGKAAPASPWAITHVGLRAKVVEFFKTFKPEGAYDAVQLENLRAYTLAEIAALPADTEAVEVKVESQIGPNARQGMVIVFKKF